jgi:hypothetical protein
VVAKACSKVGGLYNAGHHDVVNYEEFDQRAVRDWLSARVQEVEAKTWAEIGERLGRLGHWEFETNLLDPADGRAAGRVSATRLALYTADD